MHKFIYENDYDGCEPRKITIEVGSDANLTEMLETFADYLKACGFSIPIGDYLDFVNDEQEDNSGWDSFFEGGDGVSEDFGDAVRFDEYGNYGENNPPLKDDGYDEAQEDWANTHKSINDATPEDWNNAYKSVTVTYNGVKFNEHD